jgi:NAD(P)-dependent dehydrogenase (short-subunit alcohol dehydrogenase family)
MGLAGVLLDLALLMWQAFRGESVLLLVLSLRSYIMLKSKVAVVTGSTSGIGLGIAHALAAAGADLVINGFGERPAIEKLRQEMAAGRRAVCNRVKRLRLATPVAGSRYFAVCPENRRTSFCRSMTRNAGA